MPPQPPSPSHQPHRQHDADHLCESSVHDLFTFLGISYARFAGKFGHQFIELLETLKDTPNVISAEPDATHYQEEHYIHRVSHLAPPLRRIRSIAPWYSATASATGKIAAVVRIRLSMSAVLLYGTYQKIQRGKSHYGSEFVAMSLYRDGCKSSSYGSKHVRAHYPPSPSALRGALNFGMAEEQPRPASRGLTLPISSRLGSSPFFRPLPNFRTDRQVCGAAYVLGAIYGFRSTPSIAYRAVISYLSRCFSSLNLSIPANEGSGFYICA
jgi:hypothetical protein